MEFMLKEGDEKPRLFISSNQDGYKEMLTTAKDLIGKTKKIVKYWPKGKPQDIIKVEWNG